jgi:hypothetical protein
MQDVRVLRRQAGRRHGKKEKKKRLIIHPSAYVETFDNKFCKSKETFRANSCGGLFACPVRSFNTRLKHRFALRNESRFSYNIKI